MLFRCCNSCSPWKLSAAEPRSLPGMIKEEMRMPFRRGGFALTPPSVLMFVISLVLAVLALLVHYAHVSVPIINASRVFDVLAIGYIVLMIGVLFRRI